MKKVNFTFIKTQASQIFLGCLFLLVGAIGANGQCSMACNGSTNVSLDNAMCEAVITVSMVADTSGCVGGSFDVSANDASGNPIAENADGLPVISSAYVGQTIEVIVTDLITGNPCWGNLIVEDKLPPVLDCSNVPDNVTCGELNSFAPTATDNCTAPEDILIILLDEQVTINDCDDSSVSDEILQTITRTYVAEDEQGMRSNECTFTFDVMRVADLEDVDEPDNYLLINNTNLQCDESYAKLENGHPSPVAIGGLPGTGVPTLDGEALYPTANVACNLLVTFDDTELPPIGCAIKIMRTWSVLEWSCSNPQRSYEFIQMLEIVDSEGPVFDCPADLTLSTNGSSCESTMILPSVSAEDNCSDLSDLTYTVAYGNGPVLTTNGGLAQLPVGVSEVTYTVYDACLNSNSCTINVTVTDQTPPVVICDQNTTVALTSDGCAFVSAMVFDDGSYDECSDITFSVRRMDNGEPCETGTNCETEDDAVFGDYVRFCCVDQGADVMVVLRVTDAAGNVNDCMVNVEVQDKLNPTITCPGPMEVDCDFPYDESNLAAFFGEAIISDNCGILEPRDEINTDGLNQCNIGIAIRTISIGTPGTPDYSSCTQTITFGSIDLFNDGVEDSEPDTDINWPEDVTLEGCEDPTGAEYLPANLPVGSQFPTYVEGACDLVGANYEDQIFPFNNPNGDACFKIVRRWTVIDWCQFTTVNGATTYPSWTHTQVIKVNDSEGPTEIVTSGLESVCTFDAECADGFIELGATSSDECTDVLDWAYTIFTDADDDGQLDDIVVLNGVVQSFNSANNGGPSNSIDASGTYPIGTHKVLYTFSDKCGNVVSKEFVFSIVNCKAPTAYCLNGLAVDLMSDGNDGGTVQMWATDFDAGSSHPCGYDVYVSFDSIVVSATGNVDAGNGILITVNNGKEYTCGDLGDNFVDIWAAVVTPEGTIIQSYCTATLNVQDNMNNCPAGSGMRVEGSISTASEVSLENAQVQLMGSDLNAAMTDDLGAYAFPPMPVGGAYSVSPVKNDDYTNGVSTIDLVMIQRHILGLEELDSPYKVIAADVNNDEKLTPTDLLDLRKLILGSIVEFSNNGSWRFIDAAFTFEDVNDPFLTELPESYDIAALNSDMNVDFVAIKVGDVNDNAVANLTAGSEASTRTNDVVEFTVADATFTSGNTVTVPVTISDDMIATGLQFTIETGNTLELAGISSEYFDISDNNIGFGAMSNGIVTVSWNNANGVSLAADATIMELVFTAKGEGAISNDISISSKVLNAEVYNENLETAAIEFAIEGREFTTVEFALNQNTPNPFTEATDITFELPNAEAGTLTVFDVTGKVVTKIARTFVQGTNKITLNRADLNASGVLYYQLEVGAYNASRTMILVD